jgi:N-acetylmuramoyl-L-alanine amidase
MYFNTSYASPNYNDRPCDITHIVLHYTDLPTAADSIEIMCDPKRKVSAHYLIDYDGSTYNLVPDEKRAWHAGVSTWQGRDNVNDYSIGIEIQNKGASTTPAEPYTPDQMDALVELLKHLTNLHDIKPYNIIGHSDVAPGRKVDPGEHFDWLWLNEKGFGKCLI